MPVKRNKNLTPAARLNMKRIRELLNANLPDEARMMLAAKLFQLAGQGNVAALKLILQIMDEDPDDPDGIEDNQLEFVWVGEEDQPGKT